MRKYKGYTLVRRYDRRYAKWLIVGADGWTEATANRIKEAKQKVDELNKDTK